MLFVVKNLRGEETKGQANELAWPSQLYSPSWEESDYLEYPVDACVVVDTAA